MHDSMMKEAWTMWIILSAFAILLLTAALLLNRSIRQTLCNLSCGCIRLLEAPACFVYTALYDALCCLIGCTVCVFEVLLYWLQNSGLYDTICRSARALKALPLAWYPMAALTIVPICCTVRGDWAVVFLGAYCMVGLTVGATEPRPKKKNKQNSEGDDATNNDRKQTTVSASSDFFVGMNIKIDLK